MYIDSAGFTYYAAAVDIGGDRELQEPNTSTKQLARRGQMKKCG
jgi:hypothetical protein